MVGWDGRDGLDAISKQAHAVHGGKESEQDRSLSKVDEGVLLLNHLVSPCCPSFPASWVSRLPRWLEGAVVLLAIRVP